MTTIKKYLYFLFFVILIVSCKKEYRIYMLFDTVEGITDNTIIILRGVPIGRVENFKLYKNKVLVSACISNKIKLPINSTCIIHDVNALGDKIISIRIDTSNTKYLSKNDTIPGQYYVNPISIASDTTNRISLDSATKLAKPILYELDSFFTSVKRNK